MKTVKAKPAVKSGPSIAMIDYDMGNLRSVARALESAGASVRWTEKAEGLKDVDAVVLPGVGAFGVAAENLRKRGLFDPLRSWVRQDKPFLGICLGYQLLFESSEEGGAGGLGAFKGRVCRMPGGRKNRIPHIGWNQIRFQKSGKAKKAKKAAAPDSAPAIFNGIPEGAYFYFVHSYVPVPDDPSIVATVTDYGSPFASSISRGRLTACQFHPEKSGENGLRLLKNFVDSLAC